MRDINASSLVFWVGLALGACAPAVPSIETLPRPDEAPVDAATERTAAPGWSPGDGAPDRAPDAREAGAPPAPSVRVDAGSHAGADGGARDAHAEAAASGGHDARPDAAPSGEPDAPADVAEARASDAPAARAPRPGEILIDELLIDPEGNDLGHEWIEIANVTTQPLDLASLHLSDGTTDAAVDGGVLAPGGVLVLGQSVDPAHNGDAPVDLAYGTKLALNNGADRIALCGGPCAMGVTLDAFEWATAWDAAYVGHAVVIDPASRATCPAAEPYGAAGNYGSPGRANPPCASPPREASPEPGPEPSDAAVAAFVLSIRSR
jgi:hypothetical protein